MPPRVSLLKAGSLQRDDAGNILDARSSVTLITSGIRIIVDTGQKGEECLLLQALARKGLRPEDIDLVINTHRHPDHCSNNHLFSRAEVLSPREGQMIAPGVVALETPGHTMDSISILAGSLSKIAMAGDALPTFDNFIKGVPPALHMDRDLAISSMSRILAVAKIVIPGHDQPFSVPVRRYIQLP
jgi:glyoxylase-like metal-dependent hydrolase (beta-lactamase superfamily II)